MPAFTRSQGKKGDGEKPSPEPERESAKPVNKDGESNYVRQFQEGSSKQGSRRKHGSRRGSSPSPRRSPSRDDHGSDSLEYKKRLSYPDRKFSKALFPDAPRDQGLRTKGTVRRVAEFIYQLDSNLDLDNISWVNSIISTTIPGWMLGILHDYVNGLAWSPNRYMSGGEAYELARVALTEGAIHVNEVQSLLTEMLIIYSLMYSILTMELELRYLTTALAGLWRHLPRAAEP